MHNRRRYDADCECGEWVREQELNDVADFQRYVGDHRKADRHEREREQEEIQEYDEQDEL